MRSGAIASWGRSRSRTCSNVLAVTCSFGGGAKANPLRIEKVYVRPSARTSGGALAASGTSRVPARGRLVRVVELVDRNRGCRVPTAGEHLGQQAAGRVLHHGGLLLELADHVDRVVGNLLQRLLGEDVRVRPRLVNGFRIVWPVRRERHVTGLLEEVRPVGPAARQQPEAVDEDDRSGAGGVCRLDLPALASEMDDMPNLLSVAVEG